MSALSSDRKTDVHSSDRLSIEVAASAVIYGGSLVSALSGYAVPGADTASHVFRGVAVARADNSSGSNGDIEVEVMQTGVFRFAGAAGASFVQGDVGTAVTIADDQTVSKASQTTHDIACGKIVKLESATDVWVRIDGYAY